MRMLILLALLAGLAIGAAASARYIRQEVAANVAPRLRNIELQLDTLRAEVNLATELRLASINRRIDPGPSDPRD
jgi:uncharacterized membrane-anchored protein YhcB (DUF1043 family)